MAIQKMIIDLSGQGGLSNDYFGYKYLGSALQKSFGEERTRYTAEENQYVAGVFNPFTRPGYMSPSVTTVTAVTTTGTYDAQMSCATLDDLNDDVYMFEYGDTIHKGDTFIDTTWTEDRTISNAIFTDSCIYERNGVRNMWFVYKNSTSNTMVGVKSLVTGTYTNVLLGSGGSMTNNFTPILSDGKLIPAGDGYLYFLNANFVHKIDGTTVGGANGTVTQSVLTAPTYFNFSHGVDYRSNLYLVVQRNTLHQSTSPSAQSSNQNTECGVYVWNRQASFFNASDYIPLIGVREVRSIFVSPKNTIRVFCISSAGIPQIREFNGSRFVLIRELESGAFPVFEDSVTIHGNFTSWFAPNGRLYTYGTDKPDGKESLAITLEIPSVQASGSIVFCDNATHSTIGNSLEGASNSSPDGFFINYNDGTRRIGKAYPFSPYAVDSTTPTKAIGDIFTKVILLPFSSTVKNMKIMMLPWSVSGSTVQATLKFYFNQSGTSLFSKSITQDDIAKGYFVVEINKSYVNSMQIEIEHATNSLGVADFCPSYAELYYEPKTTLK